MVRLERKIHIHGWSGLLLVSIVRAGSLHFQNAREIPSMVVIFHRETKEKLHCPNKGFSRGEKAKSNRRISDTSNFDESCRHTRTRGKHCSDCCRAAAGK